MEESKRIENEAFYHFVWQHKLYKVFDLKTECGLAIELIHPGFFNTNAGPDFFNAKVKIDGVLWAGNIEIHTHAKDWYAHGHDKDAAYDNVILHVVADYNGPVSNSQGRDIPTLTISPHDYVFSNYEHLHKAKQKIACEHYLSHIDPLFWTNYKDRLASERLAQKSQHIADIQEHNQGDWEDAFFKMLCRSFGFGINSDTFERLGQSLSYKIIAKHRDHLLQLEALLFGQAGLLDQAIDDDYHRLLAKEYAFLKAKYGLRSLEAYQWKFLRLRPSNFPTVRIAQLAHLLHQHHSLLHVCITSSSKSLHKLFKAQVSNYWLTHYQFGKLSNQREKTIGESAINILLINSIAPILFSYGKHSGKTELCDKALDILHTLPAEKNHITRQWEQCGLKCENAFDSQALIQLYNNYCLKRNCMHCNIGHHYVSLQH